VKPWLTKAGPYQIEKIPCPFGGDVDLSAPPAGIMHTTEGSFDSALSVFRSHYAPHFLVGAGRIAQLGALGKMAQAVEHPAGYPETNRIARVQIEVAGYSQEQPYLFDAKTTDALAWLLTVLKDEAGIPLTRPFPDKMPAKPWATREFNRRKAGKWGKVPGWYGHVEIPGNSHWDPGALKWGALLAAAKKNAQPPAPPKPKEPRWAFRVIEANGKQTEGKTRSPRVSFDAQIQRKPSSIYYEQL
jgi:hypothetical protein